MSSWPDGRPVVPLTEDWIRVFIDPELPAVPCRSNNIVASHGEFCVVETSDGHFLGRITLFTSPIFKSPRGPHGRLLRHATQQDLDRHRDFVRREREIEDYLRHRAQALSIDLHPLKVRIPLSGRKALIYFTAEQRVDFRPLLRRVPRLATSSAAGTACESASPPRR